MKQILALYGRGNSGKSSTIKKVYEYFKKNGVQIIDESLWGREVIAVIVWEKLTIGFLSIGDNETEIKKHLPKLVKQNCDIIICATRTRGSSCKAVEKIGKEYKIIWIDKSDYISNKETEQDKLNIEASNVIIERILNCRKN